ncbi:30S ribosomal protein S13 [bacterium HR34]|nr:30S ribosomal protein S13 [bacterium HR34]
MVRILGVELDDKKQIWIALTKIYGIGKSRSLEILKKANVEPFLKTSQLTPEQLNKIKEIIEKNYKIEGELKREVLMNIRRLKEIGCWRGLRHIKGLPVRGQRTRTNNRTVRGNKRRTVGSGRKPPPSPT